MTGKTLWIALAAAVLGAAVALFVPSLLGHGPSGGAPGGEGGWSGGAEAPAAVETATVERGTFTDRAEFVGTLEARARAELYAKTPGQIEELRAETGERVEAGRVLAVIENDEQEQGLAQARAALRRTEATLTQRRAALQVAETTARRLRQLSAQNLLPQQDLDDTEAALLAARAQVQVAEAQVEEARAQLQGAQVELARTLVTAPFAGHIGKRHLDVGARAGNDQPLFSLVDLSVIRTTVPLTERDAARVEPGQPAVLHTDSFPERSFEGRVARMASVFDPQTHTTEAEIEIDNPEGLLKPGMFATVTIDFESLEDALLVPATALVERDRDTWIYIAERRPAEVASAETAPRREGAQAEPSEPGWRARRVPVEALGGRRGEEDRLVAVAPLGARLSAGERVITLGQEGLADGSPVQPVTPAQQVSSRSASAAAEARTDAEASAL